MLHLVKCDSSKEEIIEMLCIDLRAFFESIHVLKYMSRLHVFLGKYAIQWNPSNPDALGPTKNVLISGVS